MEIGQWYGLVRNGHLIAIIKSYKIPNSTDFPVGVHCTGWDDRVVKVSVSIIEEMTLA